MRRKPINAEIYGIAKKLSLDWKIHTFESKVASALIYGMDTLNLSETHLARLDYFNARCMRRIMTIPAA